MSLLLDALKKAADDKEKKSRGEPEEKSVAQENRTSSVSATDSYQAEELSLHSDDETLKNPKPPLDNVEVESDELSLHKIETEQVDDLSVDEPELSLKDKEALRINRQTSAKGESTISDDALSMLIYKTNHDVKRGRKTLLLSVLGISLAVLVSGGVFYYMDMETEIEILERKHKIAMQSMRSKTNNEKTPARTEIIRNLVSDAELEAKVEFAKKRLTVQPQTTVQASMLDQTSTNSRLSIERTNTVDPVTEKINNAWLAYEEANYTQAQRLYRDVLDIEGSNRDALLGLGAIAVLEKNRVTAREIYLSLLDLDPRDPIATAAIASLHSDESSLSSDREYLLLMLKNNPSAPHLNFALGNVYAQLNKWTAAQQRYFNAWQHDKENADYLFNLAVSMDQLSKQQQAIEFYRDSLLKASNKHVSFSREAVQKRINELTGL